MEKIEFQNFDLWIERTLDGFQLQAGYPVLYMRAGDGQLFDITNTSGMT